MGECAQAGEGSRTAVRAVRIPWRLGAVVLLAGLVLLFGAARADAMPSVAYKCSPAPQDCSGWYRSNVSIDWIVIPSDATLTGCQDKTFTADTPGTNEFCRAEIGAAGLLGLVPLERVDRLDSDPIGRHADRLSGQDVYSRHPRHERVLPRRDRRRRTARAGTARTCRSIG